MKYIRGGDYRSLTDFDDLKVGTTASKTKVGGRRADRQMVLLVFSSESSEHFYFRRNFTRWKEELSLERRRHGRLLGGVTVLCY